MDKKSKKLTLNRETVMNLDERNLTKVAGGATGCGCLTCTLPCSECTRSCSICCP